MFRFLKHYSTPVKRYYNLTSNNNDFQLQKNISFDILKLQKALRNLLGRNKFDESLNIEHFAALPINRIPGDQSSIEGHNARGLFYTKPNSDGKEVSRDVKIDEHKYTELLPEFKNTYFEEVYNKLNDNYKLGRVRLLLKKPRSTLSWHRDPEPRLHIPIISNPGAIMVIEDRAKHMPADGRVWITNNKKYHNFFNGGEESRIHLVACILDYEFKDKF